MTTDPFSHPPGTGSQRLSLETRFKAGWSWAAQVDPHLLPRWNWGFGQAGRGGEGETGGRWRGLMSHR